MSSISDLLIAQGNAQANARSQRGNIYADLIRNLSSLPGQVIQQQRATQQDALRQQALNQQLELGKGEQSLQQQRLTMAQGEAQDKQKATARQTSIDAVLGADVYNEDGDVDIEKVRTLAAKQDPSIVPHAVAVAQQLNKQTNEYRKSQADYEQAQLALAGRRNDAIGMAGLELMAPGEVDEGSYQLAIGQFVKHKLVDPQQAEAWLNASTPAERKANVASMIRGSKEARAALAKPEEVMEHDPSKALVKKTGEVVIPAVAKPEDSADAALKTARLNEINARLNGTVPLSAKDKAELGMQRARLEFEMNKKTSGRNVLSGDANRIADIDTSLNEIAALRDEVKNTGAVSKVGAMLPNVVSEFTGVGISAKERQSQIDRVKQMIGKTLEGGVLRKEDEVKYTKILPTIGDPPDVAARKLDGLERMLKQKRETTLESLDDAGFNVDAMKARGAPQAKPAAAPASTLTPGLRGLAGR